MPEGKKDHVKATREKNQRPSGTETRDAVETAIDLSKDAQDKTWEGQVKGSKRITRWTQDVRTSDAG